MASLNDVLQRWTDLSPTQIEWLHLVIGDWQLVADLSFADLVLWTRTEGGDWRSIAHVRPNTGSLVFSEDVVGRTIGAGGNPAIDQAFATGRIVESEEVVHREDAPVREVAIPIVWPHEPMAVITRHTLVGARLRGRGLEETYISLGDALARMIATGEFPSLAAPTGMRRGAPRVGDGVIHLDAEGVVEYASPNAISAIHRLGHFGDVVGEVLARIVADLLQSTDSPVDESLAVVLMGRAPWRSEVVARAGSVSLRAVPLTNRGAREGALILMRDVTELRRREQELLTKDATIREIHHRVKNNLQTVASLLRLQGRRLPPSEGKAALEEAVRRVGVIALVHERLSHALDETVDFDDIAIQGLTAVVEVATGEEPIESALRGSFGRLRAEDASALAMIISELVQNAAEHGLASGGRVDVEAERTPGAGEDDPGGLIVLITDDGVGLPADFLPGRAGLGTQIVTSLVSDLGGRIVWERVEPRGTRVRFTARLRPLGGDSY